MDREQINNLKVLAQSATPGPWKVHKNRTTGINGRYKSWYVIHNPEMRKPDDCEDELFIGGYAFEKHKGNIPNNAAFIATANPKAILELIEAYERLEEEADWLAQQASLMCDCIENCDECRLFLDCGCNGQNSKEIWRKTARDAGTRQNKELQEKQDERDSY